MHSIRPWLLVGGVRDMHDVALLRYHRIGAMLQLAEPAAQDGIVTRYLPIHDGEPLSAQTLAHGKEFILDAKADGRNTLVACGVGVSRSVSIAIAALKEAENLSLFETFCEVRRQHPGARPHPVLWRSLCAHYGEKVPYADLLRFSRTLRETSLDQPIISALE